MLDLRELRWFGTDLLRLDCGDGLIQVTALPLSLGAELHSATSHLELLRVHPRYGSEPIRHVLATNLALNIWTDALLSRGGVEPASRLDFKLFRAKAR